MAMSCIQCEIRRAKFRAAALKLLGYSASDIAKTLTSVYQADYYVANFSDKKMIMRRGDGLTKEIIHVS